MPRLILPAAIALMCLASCTSTTETTYSDVQVDSFAKVKLDSVNWTLKHRNDSLINAAAVKEAKRLDSLDQAKAPPARIVPVINERLPKREYENTPELPPSRPAARDKKDTTK